MEDQVELDLGPDPTNDTLPTLTPPPSE